MPLLEPVTSEDLRKRNETFYDFFMKGGLLKGGLGAVDFVFRAQTVKALKDAAKEIGPENIIHVQFHLDKKYPLDTVKAEVLKEMQEIAKKESYQNKFNAIKSLLRRS